MGDSRHQRITPYTPRHNGKIEHYNRILAEEFLCARTWHSEAERNDALEVWNRHYNYRRPRGAHDGQPPASATPSCANNVLAFYSQAEHAARLRDDGSSLRYAVAWPDSSTVGRSMARTAPEHSQPVGTSAAGTTGVEPPTTTRCPSRLVEMPTSNPSRDSCRTASPGVERSVARQS